MPKKKAAKPRKAPVSAPKLLTPSDRAHAYVEGVLAGKIPATDHIKRAADMWLNWHKEFDYNDKRVNARCALIEDLELPGGAIKGKFLLQPFQTFIVSYLYGFTVRETGHRACKKMLIEVSRKSGKSSLMAGLCIGELIKPLGEIDNPEILNAGVSEEVAGFVFDKVADMVEKDAGIGGGFAEKFEIKTSKLKITSDVSGGTIRKVSSGARSMEGFGAGFVIFDEIARLKDSAPINNLYSGMLVDPNHCLIMCTTQGDLPVSALDMERERTINFLKTGNGNRHYVGLHWSAEPQDDFTDEKLWAKCQPMLYHYPGLLHNYRSLCAEAIEDDDAKAEFLTKQLCSSAGKGSAWLTPDRYDAIPRIPDDEFWPIPNAHKYKHYIGLDLADVFDSSSICLLSIGEGDDPVFECRHWIFYADGKGEVLDHNGDVIRDHRPARIHKKYNKLAAQGHVITTPGPIVDHKALADKISEIVENVQVRGIFSDPVFSVEAVRMHLPPELQDRILPVGKSALAQSPAIHQINDKIKAGKFKISKNPLVREQFLNAMVKHYDSGARMLMKVHKASTYHIDCADALMCCVVGRKFVQDHDRFIGTAVRPVDNTINMPNAADYVFDFE